MKVKVVITHTVEMDIDHPVFQEIANIHRADPFAQADEVTCAIAERLVRQATGLPCCGDYPEAGEAVPGFYGVYADDGTAILEY